MTHSWTPTQLTLLFAIVLICWALFAKPAVTDDAFAVGEELYQANCASCHGPTGKGDGIMTKYLNIQPSDLTQLSAGNDGIFPYPTVVRIIDGRQTVRAHGETDMPIWGYQFQKDPMAPADSSPREEFVAGRIAALTLYLATIQE